MEEIARDLRKNANGDIAWGNCESILQNHPIYKRAAEIRAQKKQVRIDDEREELETSKEGPGKITVGGMAAERPNTLRAWGWYSRRSFAGVSRA